MKLKPIQPELAFEPKPIERPTRITTESSAEFAKICARAERGEFVIESVAVGKGNAEWIFQIRYEAKK